MPGACLYNEVDRVRNATGVDLLRVAPGPHHGHSDYQGQLNGASYRPARGLPAADGLGHSFSVDFEAFCRWRSVYQVACFRAEPLLRVPLAMSLTLDLWLSRLLDM